ncbi:hypothetical protein ACLOJK_016818 [Asimina triloba]
MDGVKVLASGFEKDEKVKIEKLVTAMGGVLQTKTSLDVSFVIAKNVLAAKYKWALNALKKPIVTSNWLDQCWNEHRIVPQEPHKILPFAGLTICATRIPADIRKEMEKLIIQNGGLYSADLTKKCDKYIVARRWGHINIVTKKWFDLSIARRACLDEELYPVNGASASSNGVVKSSLKGQHGQDKGITTSQSVLSNGIAETETTTISQNTLSVSDASEPIKNSSVTTNSQSGEERKFEGCVADDSQSEDNDLYLSECRILLVGFQSNEMRKLVMMVRRGGGTRHMSFSEKLTHIVVGSPSEVYALQPGMKACPSCVLGTYFLSIGFLKGTWANIHVLFSFCSEMKEVRHHAAWGVIKVVRSIWLQDCDREKKEIPVSERHVLSDILLPKDPQSSRFSAANGISGPREGKDFSSSSSLPTKEPLLEKTEDASRQEMKFKASSFAVSVSNSDQLCQIHALNEEHKSKQKLQEQSDIVNAGNKRSLNIFKGRLFQFSSSFPNDRRAEIVEWINQGGGLLEDDPGKKNVHFTIECHGQTQKPFNASQSTIVSTHWIRHCLEEGCMPDVGSHILYSPLPCRVPFPGFEGYRFCVSQYEEKDRLLLRNLCFVLGAKFTEKLSKKDMVIALDPFRPKSVTAQDREVGLCTMSQYPTQAAHMISGDVPSQLTSEIEVLSKVPTNTYGRTNTCTDEEKNWGNSSKRARHSENDSYDHILAAEVSVDQCAMTSMAYSSNKSFLEDCSEGSHPIPDVAAAIEDLLAQSNKIKDMMSQERNGCDRSVSFYISWEIFSPDRSILSEDHANSHSDFGISKHWLNRSDKQENCGNPSGQPRNQGAYDGFSETQTDSQVVGYEEDLSGRQMIIDRVRTRSMA